MTFYNGLRVVGRSRDLTDVVWTTSGKTSYCFWMLGVGTGVGDHAKLLRHFDFASR